MKYLRRGMWYIASRLLIFTAVVSALICAFYMGMYSSNIYIVLTEGLEARVSTILTTTDAQRLADYFHADFLSQDEALMHAFDGGSAFSDYSVSEFDYILSIESLWAWPWDTYAKATIIERVPTIKGSVKAARKGEVPEEMPTWQGGRYELQLTRSQGKWKVYSMKQLAIIIEPTPAPTIEPTPEAN